MVLPDRIELSTSPLPMECSTTELRQHARIRRIGPKGPYRRAVLATTTPQAQARDRVRRAQQGAKNQAVAPAPCCTRNNSARIRFPVSLPCAARALSEPNMTSNSIILPDSSHLIPPNWPVAGIGGKFQRGIMKRCSPSSARCPGAPGPATGVICVSYLGLEWIHDAGR